jgi:hypothetical protein
MYTQIGSQETVQPNHLNATGIDNPMQNYLTQACCANDNKINASPWGVNFPSFDYASLSSFKTYPSAINTIPTEGMLASLPSPTGLSTSTFTTEGSWDTASVGDLDNDLDQTPDFESAMEMRRPRNETDEKQRAFTEFHDFKAEEHIPKNKRKVPKSSEYV